MDNCYLGTIRLFGGSFAPKNWAFCDGSRINVSSNQALFALLGDTYGGDLRTYFNLPDLRGRAAVCFGAGPGLQTWNLGEKGGAETVTLTVAQMPQHTHVATATFTDPSAPLTGSIKIPVSADDTAVVNEVNNGYLAQGGNVSDIYTDVLTAPTNVVGAQVTVTGGISGMPTGSVTVGNTGAGAPFSIIQPSIGMNYIICVQGYFPSRN